MIDGIAIADEKIAQRKADAAERRDRRRRERQQRDRRRAHGLKQRHRRILARRENRS